MTILKRVMDVFVCLTIASRSVFAVASNIIVADSIPKCGTHFLCKCINLLTNYDQKDKIKARYKDLLHGTPSFTGKWLANSPVDVILHTHITYEEKYEAPLGSCFHFFMYRGPRDQVVSFANAIKKHQHRTYWPETATLSMDDIISYLFSMVRKYMTNLLD